MHAKVLRNVEKLRVKKPTGTTKSEETVVDMASKKITS